MIRDPSDGSVREKPKEEASKVRAPVTSAVPTPSGLREASPKDKYQARLEWSRNWLKDHQEKQRNARGNRSEQELPTSGHSIEGEREAESGASARPAVD